MAQICMIVKPLALLLLLSSVALALDSNDDSRMFTSQPDMEQKIFIDHLFQKYGNGGIITFEGLEHLMESLGLGKIKFEKTHDVSLHKTDEGEFKEVHDTLKLHTHEHNRKRRTTSPKEDSCLRPRELLTLYGLKADHGLQISPSSFLQICPAIISQLDSRVCAIPLPVHEGHAGHSDLPPTTASKALVWSYGLGSIIIVSLCGVVGFAIFPLLGKSNCRSLCSLLSSLSIGTLIGDSLLHLIPHALHDLSEEKNVLLKLSFMFVVLMGLFVYESCIHLRQRNKIANKETEPGISVTISGHQHGRGIQQEQRFQDEEGFEKNAHSGHSHDHSGSIVQMVLGGDFLHNLTDGLAIGAAYGQHPVAGFATTIAVLLHEVPHELGDLAILLDSGVTIKRALVFNIVSSLFSIVGATIGLIIGQEETYAEWIYAFTAASFLYIALATLMPEMFKKTKTMGRLLTHTTGIFFGGVIMFFIAMYEHQLQEAVESFTL